MSHPTYPTIIPVLDLLGGQVVRAVGGRRSEYRPLVTQLTDDPTPARLAAIFVERFAAREIYLADLDAIAGRPGNFAAWHDVAGSGARLWLDAGTATADAAEALLARDWPRPPVLIVGLETLRDPDQFPAIVERCGPENLAFSLDLRDGCPVTTIAAWQQRLSEEIAAEAIAAGFRRLILLDLARVGRGTGCGTGELCRRLHARYPEVELVTGGGVSSDEDLRQAAAQRAQAVLVASALHEGRLAPVRGTD